MPKFSDSQTDSDLKVLNNIQYLGIHIRNLLPQNLRATYITPQITNQGLKIKVQKNIQKIFISSLTKVPCISPGHLPGDEGLSPARALVVEEDAVTGVHVVSLAIVNHRPEEWANI